MIEYELRIKRGEQAASEILARGRSGRNIIDAIKAMRNASGISLREAKAHVDRMMFRQPAEAVRAAPEAVSEARIAGALFDFLGFLTTSEEQWKFSAYDDASPAVYALEQWADKRGFALEPCDVSGWRATTEAATQPVRAAPEAEADRERAASLVASEDTRRLDYLQQTGSTVELVPGGHGGLFFRIGGLYRAVHADIRQAIDAARSSAGEAQS